jgi:hypothetical protein
MSRCTDRPVREGNDVSYSQIWEVPYVIIRINAVVYRIQQHPRAKMIMVELVRVAPYWRLFERSNLEEGEV